jgi:hypothetical protein
VKPRVGIVGTQDLVDVVAGFRSAVPQAELVPWPYDQVAQIPELIARGEGLVDSWLFTDPLAYHRAQAETTRPTACLEYGGSTLLVGLIQLIARGEAVTHLSIDSLPSRDVQEVLAEAGVPTADIRVFNPGPLGTAEEIAETHLGFKKRKYTAVTCIPAVAEQLEGVMPTFRLTPSGEAIRTALNELVLTTTNQVNQDSQVVVGFLRCDPVHLGPAEINRIESTLGAVVATHDRNTHLVVTTRRGVLRATADLVVSPFTSLGPWSQHVRSGFGFGQNAPEAAKLAGRALQRAETRAAPATVISLRHDSDILLQEAAGAPSVVEVPSIGVVAAHSGLSVPNIMRLQKLARSDPGKKHTTRDIAEALNVEMRTARRLVQHLEQSGYAQRVGQLAPGNAGRPLTLYDIAL